MCSYYNHSRSLFIPLFIPNLNTIHTFLSYTLPRILINKQLTFWIRLGSWLLDIYEDKSKPRLLCIFFRFSSYAYFCRPISFLPRSAFNVAAIPSAGRAYTNPPPRSRGLLNTNPAASFGRGTSTAAVGRKNMNLEEKESDSEEMEAASEAKQPQSPRNTNPLNLR